MQASKGILSTIAMGLLAFSIIAFSPSCQKKDESGFVDLVTLFLILDALEDQSLQACYGNGALRSGSTRISTDPSGRLTPSFRSANGTVLPSVDPNSSIVRFQKGGLEPGLRALKSQIPGSEKYRKNLDSSDPGSPFLKIPYPYETARELESQPGILSVQPNYRYTILDQPDDPRYPSQWSLENTGESLSVPVYNTTTTITPTAGVDMDAPEAWEIRSDCSSVPIAVIDTGIDLNHEDIKDNLWTDPDTGSHGYDFYSGDLDPSDEHGHGTHVASIIGARGNNGTGMTGVCWKASLMAIRVLGPSGEGETTRLVQGIDYAIDHGARIINLSLGTDGNDPLLYDTLARAREAGILVVAAAGNDASDNDSSPTYPASYDLDNLVSVGAQGTDGKLASFSNYGSQSVDLVAPGRSMVGAWAYSRSTSWNSFYSTAQGGEWDLSGDWKRADGCYSLVLSDKTISLPALSNPGDYCSNTSSTYASTVNDVARASFDRTAYNRTSLSLEFYYNTGSDLFTMNTVGGTGDPFATGGRNLVSVSGNSPGQINTELYLEDCSSTTCTVGFKLQAQDTAVARGVSLALFGLTGENPSDNSYHYSQGTSQATPLVTGVLGLMAAHRPSAGYKDLILSLFKGARGMDGLGDTTCTGRMVNARGALGALERRIPAE